MSFTKRAMKQINEAVRDVEAEKLGKKVAREMEWDGVRIMFAFQEALTDANFHSEAKKVDDMIADAVGAVGRTLWRVSPEWSSRSKKSR